MNSKPNFLIVGAAKAGTTSLARYLNKHPDIFVPEIKEPRFFVKDILMTTNNLDPLKKHILESSVFDEVDYFKMYDVKEKMTCDASVHYLYHHKEVIPKINKYLGDIPIIIIIRNPIDRLVSNYNYLKRYDLKSIEDEIKNENFKIENNYNSFWLFKELGLYADSIAAYKENFCNVKIIIFEDFVLNTQNVYDDCIEWLNLPKHGNLINFKKYNETKKSNTIHKILFFSGITKFFKLFIKKDKIGLLKRKYLLTKVEKKTEINYCLRKKLIEYYRKDIDMLKEDHNLDLSLWQKDFKVI